MGLACNYIFMLPMCAVDDCGRRRFEWQKGYGAFTIGASQSPATIRYIENQPRHHRKTSVSEEWEMFLRRHAVFMD